ncbi:hypothetical protein NEOLEDRAFT_1177620 [Neolentinus lepideus HHB14362 ss-1]|uniref:Uncharacterized protein n=1 Tax=Neolentinus lepideus HHB14362 ss-1 TaxID=1314782 RepID=A0A165TGQ2_9AGAM|nr:hypothetical protein NEOLEDRAFT_1177620 [Neolentinus lepideus HHB14362 ss-1]
MFDRLGADVFWNRFRLLYQIEARKSALTFRRPLTAKFRPGDIVFAWGGITNAWFDYLRLNGFKLTRTELALEKSYRSMLVPGRVGKFCVILKNINSGVHKGKYLVCNLTTFRNMRFTATLRTPMNNFFALAFGSVTEPWPPNFPPILVNPRWTIQSYVHAIPAVRDVIPAKFNMYSSLAPGELDRLQAAVRDRVKRFPTHSAMIREYYVDALQSIRENGLDVEYVEEYAGDAVPMRQNFSGGDVQDTEGLVSDSEMSEFAEEQDKATTDLVPRGKRRSREERSYFKPLHFLSLKSHDITWSMKFLEDDIKSTPHWASSKVICNKGIEGPLRYIGQHIRSLSYWLPPYPQSANTAKGSNKKRKNK